MKKHFSLLLVFNLLAICGFGQQLKDAVYLKNGELIYGSIVEIIPDSTIKIKTTDGSIFIYNMDEVEKILKEDKAKPKEKDSIPSDEIKKGYKGFFNVYKGFGSLSMTELSTFHGVQKTANLFFGGGIGLLSYGDSDIIFLPTFNTRFNFMKSKFTPFVDLKIAHGITKAIGFHINPSIGYRLGGVGAAFNISGGYLYQEGGNYWEEDGEDNDFVSIFYIGFGIEF